ncbi:flavodoxin family protein [Candidatus Omnitrophota bacterium]
MKALLISSSPHKHKSNTFILAQEVLRGLTQEGIACETIHLSEHHISFCEHCQACHIKILNCSINDAIPLILNKMLEADAIILASPNYISQVTASMKALFDRSGHFIHCIRLLGKYMAAVVTSASGQDQEILDYIQYYANTCGAQYSGGVSSSINSLEEKRQDAYQLGKKLAEDIKTKRAFPQQQKIIQANKENFRKIITLRKDQWQEEYNYWKEKCWL